MSTTAPARRASPYSTRFKIVAALIIAVAVGLFGVFIWRLPEDNDSVIRSGGNSEFVDLLIPASDSQVPQQSTVGIDLAAGWQGVLVVNGQELTADQVDETPALNKIEFTPGPGKVVDKWPAGQTCVLANVWESAVGREEGQRSVSWCFEVY
jgi:hypothetical protein